MLNDSSIFYHPKDEVDNTANATAVVANLDTSAEGLTVPQKLGAQSRNGGSQASDQIKKGLQSKLKRRVELQKRRLEVLKQQEEVMNEKSILLEKMARRYPGSFVAQDFMSMTTNFSHNRQKLEEELKSAEGEGLVVQQRKPLSSGCQTPRQDSEAMPSKLESVLDLEEINDSHPSYYHPLIVPQGRLHPLMEDPREMFLKALGNPLISGPDLDELLISPVPAEVGSIQLVVEPAKSGFFSKNYLLRLAAKPSVLLVAKKQTMFKQESNYHIQKTGFSQEQVGKLRGNFLGTEFCLYSKGQNPKEASSSQAVRRQEGVIRYSKDVVGKAPRKFEVGIPMVGRDEKRTRDWADSLNYHERLLFAMDRKSSDVIGLKNKQPVWNEDRQQHFLDFTDRISKVSAKNFVLVDSFDDSKHYMQFGKTKTTNEFALDCAFPMSILQAFGVAVSALDLKLGCA